MLDVVSQVSQVSGSSIGIEVLVQGRALRSAGSAGTMHVAAGGPPGEAPGGRRTAPSPGLEDVARLQPRGHGV